METIQTYLLPHWAFFCAAAVFAVVGEVTKRTLFTKKRAAGNRAIWIGRKTLPLHPVVAAILIGWIPGMPVSAGVEGPMGAIMYYVFAGITSTWVFSVAKAMAKKRGIELELPGHSDYPPAKESDELAEK